MEAWITPFAKQCFVTTGVAINVGQFGMVMAFTAILLPQLSEPRSYIQIDESSASWIAAVPGFALVLGNLTVPSIMGKYGRKVANIISVVIMIAGWLCVAGAQNITTLIVARLLQGLSMGMSTSLGPILIGEYTSPHNRGPFLSTMGLSMSVLTLVAHTLGTYVTWDVTAIICAALSLLDLVIVLNSPESPSWLADRGEYDACVKVFHWLRGNEEEDELKRMIEASQIAKEIQAAEESPRLSFGQKVKRNLGYFCSTIRKKEFYKPIVIVIHMYMITHWGGINLISAFTLETFHRVLGDSKYDAVMIISLDVQRLVSNAAGVLLVRRVRRRRLLFATLALNAAALLATGLYAYLRTNGLLAYDHVVFGALLIHLHAFSVVTGSLPLPMVISGEIFPMRYRSLAGGISAVFYSLNFFVTIKSVLYLFRTVQLYGAYFIYAGVLSYCCVVAWFLLPETKDRTLQDIEREFRGADASPDDLKCAQPLKPLTQTSA